MFTTFPKLGAGIVPIVEILFGLDKVKIDDSKY